MLTFREFYEICEGKKPETPLHAVSGTVNRDSSGTLTYTLQSYDGPKVKPSKKEIKKNILDQSGGNKVKKHAKRVANQITKIGEDVNQLQRDLSDLEKQSAPRDRLEARRREAKERAQKVRDRMKERQQEYSERQQEIRREREEEMKRRIELRRQTQDS